MPGSNIEFWWILLVSVVVGLSLCLGLVFIAISSQKTRLKLHKEKLEVLENSEKKYRDLFDGVSDVIYIHSLDGTVIQVNRIVEELVGAEVSQIIGRPITAFLSKRFKEKFQDYLSDLESKNSASGIIPLSIAPEGKTIFFEYRSSVYVGDDGSTLVHGIAHNITERIAYEHDLRRAERRANQSLVRAKSMQEDLSKLSREVIHMQEEDRKKISRELHDEMGQLLATLSMNLETLRKDSGRDPGIIKISIRDMKRIVEQIFARVHDFLSELRPAVLDELGLSPALRYLVRDFSKHTGIEVVFNENKDVELLDSEQKIVVFRVVQESLTNAAKHAHPRVVAINVKSNERFIDLEISDDGDGFEPRMEHEGTVLPRRHLGILGMQERVKLARGKFTLTSARGRGTTIDVKIPIGEVVRNKPD